MIILGIPLVLGLLWNKWAGGAAGFIMGGMYYVASAGQYNGLYAVHRGYSLTTSLATSVCSSGLFTVSSSATWQAHSTTDQQTSNECSLRFNCFMIVSVIKAYMNYTARLNLHGIWLKTLGARSVLAVVTNFVPRIALGVIVPILAKVMTWYGIQPQRHQLLTSPTSFLINLF